LRLFVGVILILFGLKWLKKALLRYSGLKALHDEEAIFEEKMAELRASGITMSARIQPTALALAYKGVLLEGLEVAFIVIKFGSSATVTSGLGGIPSAALGATAAGLLVILAGAVARAPLTQVPENTLKFVVGIMLTTFGTFWTVEGFQPDYWPFSDAFLLVLAAIYLLASLTIVQWLKGVKSHQSVVAKLGEKEGTMA
jgi:uncharacterized membrane protein